MNLSVRKGCYLGLGIQSGYSAFGQTRSQHIENAQWSGVESAGGLDHLLLGLAQHVIAAKLPAEDKVLNPVHQTLLPGGLQFSTDEIPQREKNKPMDMQINLNYIS